MNTAADARATAVELQQEAFARRIDPITEIWTHLDEVNVTVCPTDTAVWKTWCSLFAVDDTRTVWARGIVDTVGVWNGIRINLRGLDTERWAS